MFRYPDSTAASKMFEKIMIMGVLLVNHDGKSMSNMITEFSQVFRDDNKDDKRFALIETHNTHMHIHVCYMLRGTNLLTHGSCVHMIIQCVGINIRRTCTRPKQN